ncbi:hypothetical protein HMPREF3188_00050 [Tissierellia bacterium KA00581]|jgi:ribbon-helix-helix protein, copG family|nr:hypothetical protein HMPREF3188_00050 [Tissierellia bacterium KA00581]
MKETYLLRLTEELKEKLREVAENKGVSINALIVEILWQSIKK